MMKHNLIAGLVMTLAASSSFAQESFVQIQDSANELANAAVITVNPDAVLNLQLSGQASDPIEALGQIADELAAKHGLQIHKEIVNGQYALVVSGNIDATLQQESSVVATQSLSGKQEQFAPLRIFSLNCSALGLGGLVECRAVVTGGTPAYSYNWQAANSTATAIGEFAFIDSCAVANSFESFRLTVTDSAGSSVSRNMSVNCVNNPWF